MAREEERKRKEERGRERKREEESERRKGGRARREKRDLLGVAARAGGLGDHGGLEEDEVGDDVGEERDEGRVDGQRVQRRRRASGQRVRPVRELRPAQSKSVREKSAEKSGKEEDAPHDGDHADGRQVEHEVLHVVGDEVRLRATHKLRQGPDIAWVMRATKRVAEMAVTESLNQSAEWQLPCTSASPLCTSGPCGSQPSYPWPVKRGKVSWRSQQEKRTSVRLLRKRKGCVRAVCRSLPHRTFLRPPHENQART
eukprot:385311-Rhodomonas_salina.2